MSFYLDRSHLRTRFQARSNLSSQSRAGILLPARRRRRRARREQRREGDAKIVGASFLFVSSSRIFLCAKFFCFLYLTNMWGVPSDAKSKNSFISIRSIDVIDCINLKFFWTHDPKTEEKTMAILMCLLFSFPFFVFRSQSNSIFHHI